jgi:RNA polymerase sigma factor (sigma-70 family)
MPGGASVMALNHFRKLVGACGPEPIDRELLERFAAVRDELAFAELVRRHGPLVLGVCRRLLRDHHDAEDAFQATFLVLAKKAGSVRWRGSVTSWLFEVACRTARKARGAAARRRALEGQVRAMRPSDPVPRPEPADAGEVIEEFNRLPDHYRAPLLLCHVQGQTTEEAGRLLGCPAGTVKSRLARGRDLLRARLARRGVALPAGGLAVLVAQGAAPAAVPANLAETTVAAALRFAAGAPVGPAGALAEGVMRMVFLNRLNLLAAVLTLGLLAGGLGAVLGVAAQGPTGQRPSPVARARAEAQPRPEAKAAPGPEPAEALPKGALAVLGDLRLRHEGPVPAAAFSPDGKLLAFADGLLVRLWDVPRERELPPLKGHTQYVRCLAFARDGTTLATGSTDLTVRLWDARAGKQLQCLRGHTGDVVAVSLSPNGRVVASAQYETGRRGEGVGLEVLESCPVRLWDAATGKQVRLLESGARGVSAVAFAPDGKTLAVGCADQSVSVWELASGQVRAVLRDPESGVGSVAFSPDGKLLAASNGKAVRLWDVATGHELRRCARGPKDGPPGGMETLTVRFSADGKTVASGSGDGSVGRWDVATGKELPRLKRHLHWVMCLDFSPDGKLLATGSWGARGIRLTELATGKDVPELAGHPEAVTAVAFSADGKVLASGSADRTVRLWDAARGRPLRVLVGHTGGVTGVVLLPDGRRLASGSLDGTVRLWEVAAGKEVSRLQGAPGGVLSVAVSPDGGVLAAGGVGGTVGLWDLATGKAGRRLVGHEGSVTSLAFTADGKHLLTASHDPRTPRRADRVDNTVRCWDVTKGVEVWRKPRHAVGVGSLTVAASGGKELLVFNYTGGDFGRLPIWDAGTGKEVRRLGSVKGLVGAVALAPGGKTLAVGRTLSGQTREHQVGLWDVASGKEVRRFLGHRGAAQALAFAPGGRVLASGSADGTVILWDVASLSGATGQGR